MARDVLGEIDCPHCGQVATVHQNARGAALRYYRCGEVLVGASSGCGTVQIYGRSGQAWIERHLRPVGADPKASPPAPAPIADPLASPPAPITQPAPAPARKSVLDTLAHLLSEE